MRTVSSFAAIATAVALVTAAQTGLSGAASASGAPAAAPVTQYVKAEPACGVAAAGRAQCLAIRRVPVSASTPGAKALVLAPGYATGPATGYTPADLATAYGINAATAAAVTVGIVDAYDDPNARADLNVFDAHYGLPAETSTSFRKVSQTGSTAYPVADAGWASEISLDLDAVRGLCHTCKIVLVEAKSSYFTDLAIAENEAVALGAQVVTNSYGGAERGPLPSGIASAYNHPGVVITASTGDDGMFDWDYVNAYQYPSNAPQFPASLNTVVAVGGTTLHLNANATRSAESVWNENGTADVTGRWRGPMGASGGGCSTQVTAARWQSAVPGYGQTGCGSKRLAGDIAALADPYTGYDIYDTYHANGWQTYGGTSLASPLVAAMWAVAGGSGGVAYPALSLYGHFTSDATHPLYDVTAGGNGLCAGSPAAQCASILGQVPNTLGWGTLDCAWAANSSVLSAGTRACDAAPGYDGPSGVGTPVGVNAFKAMAPTARVAAAAVITHRISTSLSAKPSTDPFPGATFVSYDWTFGDGTMARTVTPAVAHTYAAAGAKSVTLKITDCYARVASVTLRVTVR